MRNMQSGKPTKKTKKSTMESQAHPEVIGTKDSPRTAKRDAKPLATAPAPVTETPVPMPKPLTTKSRVSSGPIGSTPLHRAAKPVTVLAEPTREVPLVMAAAAGAAKESVIDIAPPRPVCDDDVAKLAYSYWLARGKHGGSPYEDWIRAEHELRSGR
jgi:Protein of unknown function (DUF2934)